MIDLKKFGPRPSISEELECFACKKLIGLGDYTALVPLGPGDDPKSQNKCLYGRPYDAVAIEIHWACATGEA